MNFKTTSARETTSHRTFFNSSSFMCLKNACSYLNLPSLKQTFMFFQTRHNLTCTSTLPVYVLFLISFLRIKLDLAHHPQAAEVPSVSALAGEAASALTHSICQHRGVNTCGKCPLLDPL